MRTKCLIAVYLLTGCLFASAGCASGPDKVPDEDKTEETIPGPDWAGDHPDACAVGIVKYGGNDGLARSTSTSRARDALARQLRSGQSQPIQQHQSLGTGCGSGNGFTDKRGETLTESRTETVSRCADASSGSRLPDTIVVASHITEEDDPRYYSLACVKPSDLSEIAGSNAKRSEIKEAKRKLEAFISQLGEQ